MRWLAWLLLALAATPAAAQSVTVDGITVHYAAVAGTEIASDVARQLGIVRSPQRILINVAVRRGEPGHEQAVPADVSVQVLDGDARSAPRMRLHADGGAQYWLGEARIDGDARLRFEVDVRVPGRVAPITVAFSREFFVR